MGFVKDYLQKGQYVMEFPLAVSDFFFPFYSHS